MLIIKDIFLLILGGLITFLITYIINKIQSRKPVLSWRILPPVYFPSQELTAINLSLENNGTKAAKNVKALISCPKEVKIESFDIQKSEKAMDYKIHDTKKTNEIELYFPNFNYGLECILTFMAKQLKPRDINVSIVGEDIVGKRKTSEKAKSDKLLDFVPKILIFIAIIFSLFIGYEIVRNLASINHLQQIEIANLYMETGKYDLAIDKYKKVINHWWVPFPKRTYYELAKAYAHKGDAQRATVYLKEFVKKDPESKIFIEFDESFNTIKSSEEFKKLIKNTINK